MRGGVGSRPPRCRRDPRRCLHIRTVEAPLQRSALAPPPRSLRDPGAVRNQPPAAPHSGSGFGRPRESGGVLCAPCEGCFRSRSAFPAAEPRAGQKEPRSARFRPVSRGLRATLPGGRFRSRAAWDPSSSRPAGGAGYVWSEPPRTVREGERGSPAFGALRRTPARVARENPAPAEGADRRRARDRIALAIGIAEGRRLPEAQERRLRASWTSQSNTGARPRATARLRSRSRSPARSTRTSSSMAERVVRGRRS